MPLTLAITDAANGAGGTATITGSAGATNTLFYAPWTGQMMSVVWTPAGTVVGDGSITQALGTGYFVFQLVSDGALGPWAYRNFTDASTDPVHYQYLLGTKARINELNLPPLLSGKTLDSRKIQWLPRALEVDLAQLPLLCISPPGFEVNVSEVMNQDDYLYPVITAIMVDQKQDSVANLPTVLKWREQILRAISYQRIAGIIPSMWAEPKLMAVVDPDSFVNRGILLSVLGFGFRTRLTRGLT